LLIGTVSRELRWVLLYINRKLFSRAIVTHHNFFYFVKGTLHNQQKKIQLMNTLQFQIVWTILDVTIFCVRIILDSAKIHMDKTHKDFIIFNILGRVKRILEIRYQPYRTTRSQGSTYNATYEYNALFKIWKPL